jgi:hypothetical protein
MQCEIETPLLREKYEKEVQAMFEKQLGVAGRGMYAFWTIFCLAISVHFSWVAVASYGKLPVLITVSFGIGIVFALGFAGLSAWIAYSGRMLLKIHPPIMVGLVWAFTVIMVTIFMVVAPNSIIGLRMVLSGLVFLVMAAAFVLASRTEQAELRTKEKLLEIEYRLTELSEKIGSSQRG